MGNYFGANCEETFKRNQDFVTEMNAIKIERQMHMQNQIREREIALQIAKDRELFYWFGAFYVASTVYLLSKYRLRKGAALTPLIPLSFVMGYQADLAYGNKLHRIRMEAEKILQFEQDLLVLPLGVPTASAIDTSRLENDEQRKLHPVLP